VRGQSDPTRMGEALSVEHENIGLTAELAYGGENGRGLPETEQPGHVGEPDRTPGQLFLDHLSAPDIPDDDAHGEYGGNSLLKRNKNFQITSSQ